MGVLGQNREKPKGNEVTDMRSFFVWSLVFFLAAFPGTGRPQSSSKKKAGVLSPGEIRQIAQKLSKYTALQVAYQAEKRADRKIKLGTKKAKAFEALRKTIQALEKRRKFKFLASTADLRAVLAAGFNYKKTRTRPGDFFQGEFKEKIPGSRQSKVHTFGYWIPKKYPLESRKKPYPLIISLPTKRHGSKNWYRGRDHLKNTFSGSPLLEDFLMFSPDLPPELDPKGKPANPDQLLSEWLGPFLFSFNEFLNSHKVDWNRIILEGGKESTSLALYFANVAPRYFAGLVLRDPGPLEGAVVRDFANLPTLFLVSSATKPNAEWFLKLIKLFKYDNCTVLEGEKYPFPSLGQKLVDWVRARKRNPAPPHLVFQPLFSGLGSHWWIQISKYDKFVEDARTEEDLPVIEVTADRKTNRITVNAKNISSYNLLLNDDLVDLEKPVTVVTNGKAEEFKMARSLSLAILPALNNDPQFVTTYTLAGIQVPKVESQSTETKKKEEGGGGGGVR